ncbi:hypothetical protein L208DRAFT_1414226, partial [Tricholoma matsutake]
MRGRPSIHNTACARIPPQPHGPSAVRLTPTLSFIRIAIMIGIVISFNPNANSNTIPPPSLYKDSPHYIDKRFSLPPTPTSNTLISQGATSPRFPSTLNPYPRSTSSPPSAPPAAPTLLAPPTPAPSQPRASYTPTASPQPSSRPTPAPRSS